MNLLTETNNPFINVAVNIANNKNCFDKSSFKLINFLLDNQKFQPFDLNEKILIRDNINNSLYYTNKEINYFSNFFNTIFIIENSFNPQLINKMVDSGLIFDPFYRNENNEIINDILFSRPELSGDRNIFLLELYLKQHGLENFTSNIAHFNTLNKCILLNKLDVAEFILKHVSIDLTNDNLETPIMYAKNLTTLNFLVSYNPTWNRKNIFNQDCSYFFSLINDGKLKEDMLNLFLSELSKSNNSEADNNEQYIQKRLEETLINLVTKDATKLELQTFLKKYKLKNTHLLTDQNNRTLGHICVSNEDFPRFELFNNTDLYHTDNNGYNIFTTLFSKNRLYSNSKISKAKTLFLKCLEEPDRNITSKNIDKLIEIPFDSSNPLPEWILKDNLIRYELFKLLDFLDNDYENKTDSPNRLTQSKLYFDLLGKFILKYDLKILENDNMIKKMFIDTSDSEHNLHKEHYFNKGDSEIVFLLLEKCETIGKINLNDFLSDKFTNINQILFQLKKSFIVYNSEKYENVELLKEANNQKFYKDVCKPFFEFISDKKWFTVIEKIDEDLINQTLKIDSNGDLNEFLKTFSYLKLNNKLKQNNNKLKQNTKI